jgi:hypothetical protein
MARPERGVPKEVSAARQQEATRPPLPNFTSTSGNTPVEHLGVRNKVYGQCVQRYLYCLARQQRTCRRKNYIRPYTNGRSHDLEAVILTLGTSACLQEDGSMKVLCSRLIRYAIIVIERHPASLRFINRASQPDRTTYFEISLN